MDLDQHPSTIMEHRSWKVIGSPQHQHSSYRLGWFTLYTHTEGWQGWGRKHVGAWELSASFGFNATLFFGSQEGRRDRERVKERVQVRAVPSRGCVINCSNNIMSMTSSASSASCSTASNHVWHSYFSCVCVASCRAMSWVSLNNRHRSQTGLVLCQLYSAQGFCTTVRHAGVCRFGSALCCMGYNHFTPGMFPHLAVSQCHLYTQLEKRKKYVQLVNILAWCCVWCLGLGIQHHPN